MIFSESVGSGASLSTIKNYKDMNDRLNREIVMRSKEQQTSSGSLMTDWSWTSEV